MCLFVFSFRFHSGIHFLLLLGKGGLHNGNVGRWKAITLKKEPSNIHAEEYS